MANETKITDVVDKSCLAGLDALNLKINTIVETYQKAVKEIGSGLSIKVNGLEDYSKKLQALTAAMEKSVLADNALKEAKKEQEALLKKTSEQIRESIKEALEKAKVDKIAEQSALTRAKADTERLKQEKLLNQEKRISKTTTEAVVAALNTEAKTMQEARAQNKLLRAERNRTVVNTEEGRKRILELNVAIDKNTELLRRNSDSYAKQKMAIGDYQEQIKGAIVSLRNGGSAMKNFGIVARGFGGIMKNEASIGVQSFGASVGTMIKGMVGAQAVISGIRSLIGKFKEGIQTAIDFQAANSKLAAILGTTSGKIKDLTADARRLGAATVFTASEVTNLQVELSKLGFSQKEILNATEYVLQFSQATGAALPEAAALAGATLRMFGADTKETARYVSAMAVATTKSALSFSYLQTAMPIAGSVAKTYGFEVEEVLALLGRLADAGIDASSAATATRNIFLNLANGGGKLSEAMGGNVKTLNDFVAGLKRVKDGGVELAEMLEMTDKRSVNAFSNFVAGADSLLKLKDSITGVEKELGVMANTMTDNVAGAMKGFGSAWDELMLSILTQTGSAKKTVDFLSDGIRNLAKMHGDQKYLEDSARAQAKKNSTDQAKEFKIEEQHILDIKQATESLVATGVNASDATKKAIEEKKKYLNEEIKKYGELATSAEASYQKVTKAANDSNIFTRAQSGKSRADYDKERGGFWTMLTESEKAAEKYKYVLDNIDSFESNFLKKDEAKKVQTKELTDDQKKAAEKAAEAAKKAAAERLRIQEVFQQSSIELMDEGLAKEIAKISHDYTKRMAAVKGFSDEEVATRSNLAEQMRRALEEKSESFTIAKEQRVVANKLEVVKKGSEEELNLKAAQLDLLREVEVKEAIRIGDDTVVIEEKYQTKRVELIGKFANERLNKMRDEYAGQSAVANQAMQNELELLTKQYAGGEVNKEEFERRKSDITVKYGIMQAESSVELARKQLDIVNLSAEDEEVLKKKLAEAEIALSNAVMDAEVANAEKTADAHKKKMEKVAESIQMVGDLLNSFADLGTALFERKIQEVEEEQDANNEAGDREIERIEKLAGSGAISAEEAEARKRAAEQKTATKEAELAKKKADLQTKQAKMEKANSIVQAIMSTSLAIMKQLATTPLPLGAPMVALIAAMGAIQLATIVAQPIPKYAKGTDNHPGGLAVVGDGGKHEAVVVGSRYFVTPNTSTLVDLPTGAKVIPDIDKEMADLHQLAVMSDAMMLYRAKREDGSRVTINNDYSELRNEMKTTNRILLNMDKKKRRVSNSQSFNNYVNSRI